MMARLSILWISLSYLAPALAAGATASSYQTEPLPSAGAFNTTMAVADFDNDFNIDLAIPCFYPPKSLRLYLGDGEGGFSAPNLISEGLGDRVYPAYVNADEHTDLIGVAFTGGNIFIYMNEGTGSFSPPTIITGSTTGVTGLTTGYFDSDQHLDLVVFGNSTLLYFGDGSGGFSAPISPAGDATGGGTLDANGDGATDLVTFTGRYVSLFLGDGQGGLAISDIDTLTSVPDPFSSADGPQLVPGEGIIDFNEDGHPDVLVAETQPPVEGPSFVHVLFTDGTGQFTSRSTVSVVGRCQGLTALDYDYDGHLDIAAGSTAERRIHVFFGDGLGGIRDSVSFSSGTTGAMCLYATDFKEDGLWDFAAGDVGDGAAVFTDLATEPAPVVLGAFEARASRTVRLRVSNPRELTVEDLGYHIPSAKIHRRDADSDGSIEDVFKDVTLHDGDYIAQVYPAASAAPGATYSLTAEIAGVPLQFARNAFIPQAGNTYPILVYTGAASRVSPRTGSFTPNTAPAFDWSHDVYRYPAYTTYTFQLDDNYDFSSPVVSAANLTEPYYQVTTPLSTDTLFYWRYITDYEGVGEYSTVFAINITNCVCPAQGDFDANAAVDALDLAQLIDVVFFGAPDEQGITCPSPRADFDCSGHSDVVDLAAMIDHVFFGGAAPCGPCD